MKSRKSSLVICGAAGGMVFDFDYFVFSPFFFNDKFVDYVVLMQYFVESQFV